eukprot:2379263-Rhodomonas_salina.4
MSHCKRVATVPDTAWQTRSNTLAGRRGKYQPGSPSYRPSTLPHVPLPERKSARARARENEEHRRGADPLPSRAILRQHRSHLAVASEVVGHSDQSPIAPTMPPLQPPHHRLPPLLGNGCTRCASGPVG